MALTPTLSLVDKVATIADGEATYENILLYCKADTNQWGALGVRTGNGDIDFTATALPNGTYTLRVMSVGSPGTVSDTATLVINNAASIASYPDSNWDRWIFASVSQHFEDRRGTVPLYIEGMHRETNELEEFIELRIDGPWFTEISRNCWKIFVEINVLCQVVMNNQNFHRMRALTGLVSRIFDRCIKVYKFGNNLQDDQSQFCVLQRQDGGKGREKIQISHFGQIEPKLQLEQATVEAHYSVKLSVD